MEGEDGRPPAGLEAVRQMAKKCFERIELIIYRDSQGLKDPANPAVNILP